MPVTFIAQIIFGVENVADLRFDRDIKEAVYNANQESINSIKLQLRILESQLRKRMVTIEKGYLNERNMGVY